MGRARGCVFARRTGETWPGRCLAGGLTALVSGEEEERGGVGGLSRTQISVQARGLGGSRRRGRRAFSRRTLPSFLLSFPIQLPLGRGRKGKKSQDQGCGSCPSGSPRLQAVWGRCRQQWGGGREGGGMTVTLGFPVGLRQRSWSHFLLGHTAGSIPLATVFTETLVMLFLLEDKVAESPPKHSKPLGIPTDPRDGVPTAVARSLSPYEPPSDAD